MTPAPADPRPPERADRGIDAMLREYIDAGIAAGVADHIAGPHADTDPDVDRAWERVSNLRTEIGLHIRALEGAALRAAPAGEGGDDGAWMDALPQAMVPDGTPRVEPTERARLDAAALAAWKAFAQHQEHCAVCGESIDDCDEGATLRHDAYTADRARAAAGEAGR